MGKRRRAPRLKVGEELKRGEYSTSSYPKEWEYKDDPVKHNNKQCETCKYRSGYREGKKFTEKIMCDYLLKTGHMRGCPPPPNCAKYDPSERKKGRPQTFNPHSKNGFGAKKRANREENKK